MNPEGVVDDRHVAFLIAGVQKGGTTALFDYLVEHPALDLPAIKEAHFFDDERGVDWAAPDYARYHALFSRPAPALRGEATPIYVYWPQCLERIAAYNPAMKLILLFRDPVERAWSHWRMEYGRGAETRPFAWCIREGRHRVATDAVTPGFHREYSYVERGFYGAQLERLYKHFPRRQTLLLTSEDLAANPGPVLARVTEFLEVPPFPGKIEARRSHVGREMRPSDHPTAEDVALLRSIYASDQVLFAELSGRG